MGVASRGFRNAFRNSVRTMSIIFILAVSISMALIMLMAMKTVQAKIESVKSSIGNFVTIAPAGIRGFEGGGELLTAADVAAIKTMPHVSEVIEVMSDRLSSEIDTSLQSSIEPGSFGNRQRRINGNGADVVPDRPMGTTGSIQTRSFTMPVMVTATSDLSSLASLNVNQFNIISGEAFATDSIEIVALLGKELAAKNSLTVGSVFQAYGKDIRVAGIFESGNTFTDGSIIMPVKTLQNLSEQTDQLSSIIVQADSIDSVSVVQNDIKTKLGSRADVTSQQDSSKSVLAPLENIRMISLYSLIGSLIAGAIIIFLTMVMIVRERRREIGVLKAIGASNVSVMYQFVIESLVLTFASGAVGVVLGLVLSNPVLKVLVNNSASAESVVTHDGPGRAGRELMMRLGNVGADSIKNLQAAVGWEIIIYGFLAAVVIAIVGSAIPSFIIAKVRPAEVMRAE